MAASRPAPSGVTEALNAYLDFPELAQAFLIERRVLKKKTGERSCELAYGITSRPASEASLSGSCRSTGATGS